MASDLAHTDALAALHTRGNTLLIKGRPLQPLPREVLPCFAYSIIDLADERRDGMPPPGAACRATFRMCRPACRPMPQMTEAFGRGAIAVLGWPIDDPAPAKPGSSRGAQPELSAVVELINRVDRQESRRPAGSGDEERPDHGLQADALHQLAGLRPERRGHQLPPRHHAAGLPAAQALAGAAAGRRQPRRRHEAGDLRRRAPRPADGRAGPRQRLRRRGPRRAVHLRRVFAARPADAPALCRAAQGHPHQRGGARGLAAPARTAPAPIWPWCRPSRRRRCTTSAMPAKR